MVIKQQNQSTPAKCIVFAHLLPHFIALYLVSSLIASRNRSMQSEYVAFYRPL